MLRKETLDRLRRLNGRKNRLASEAATAKTSNEFGAETRQDKPQSPPPISTAGDAAKTRNLLRQRIAKQSPAASRPPGDILRTTRPSAPLRTLPAPRGGSLSLGKEIVNDMGKNWLVRRPLVALWPDATRQIAAWQPLPPLDKPVVSKNQQRKANKPSAAEKQHRDYESFRASFPSRCVFLDLETCGLAGASIFLAGLLHHLDGEWVLSQFWARNYAEEHAMLESVKSCLANQQVLVTFNGKSFDWPQVRDRCVLHAGAADCGLPELIHVDLLHLARQRWKLLLPDCKLQTLERFICGRHRTDDIPGRDIPVAYDEYVRSGRTDQMDSVLHHNALDIVTLLELAMRWDGRLAAERCA